MSLLERTRRGLRIIEPHLPSPAKRLLMTTNRLSARRVLIWAIWSVLAVGMGSGWFAKSPTIHLGMSAAAAEMSQEEFEQRARTFLLEHPEVLMEAIGCGNKSGVEGQRRRRVSGPH